MTYERIPLDRDGFPIASYVHILPCGKSSSWDGTGWRCRDCMAIWGSIACGCSDNRAEGTRVAGSEATKTL